MLMLMTIISYWIQLIFNGCMIRIQDIMTNTFFSHMFSSIIEPTWISMVASSFLPQPLLDRRKEISLFPSYGSVSSLFSFSLLFSFSSLLFSVSFSLLFSFSSLLCLIQSFSLLCLIQSSLLFLFSPLLIQSFSLLCLIQPSLLIFAVMKTSIK